MLDPMLNKVDHVAIAVRDLDAAIDHYREMYGVEPVLRETIEDQQVEEALIPVGESLIQLLMPTSPDSTVARFLERNGEGLHHVGYRVADCGEVLEEVKAQGARVVDEHPRTGSRGTTVAFLHPKTSFGTLIELVEE